MTASRQPAGTRAAGPTLAGGTGAAPELIVHPDEQTLADVTAGRLLAAILDAQSLRGVASIVLTGGGIGIAVLSSLAASPSLLAVDWGKVDLWWGDERWVADDDPDRNERQAQDALLRKLALDPSRVHPMLGSDESGSPEEAAATYAAALASAAPAGAAPAGAAPAGAPSFDVCMLGMGPEGHTASMFPGTPAIREREALVVGVHDCPKPPSERVSMTLPALNHSREIWLIVSGGSKAEAVGRVIAGAPADEVPAAGVRGQGRTLLLVDAAAASQATLPPRLRPLAR